MALRQALVILLLVVIPRFAGAVESTAATPARPAPAARSAEELGREVLALIGRNEIDAAEKLLLGALPGRPDLEPLRDQVARHLWDNGSRGVAVRLIDAAPLAGPDALRRRLLAASLHLELAEDGPNVERRAGMVSYRRSNDEEAERRFVAAHLAAAEQSARDAQKLEPANRDALGLLVVAQVSAERLADALASLDARPELVRKSSRLSTMRGNVLAGLKRDRDALAAFSAALQLEERNVKALRGYAEVAERSGDKEKARAARDKAQLFDFLLPSSELPYTAERGRIATVLTGHGEDRKQFDQIFTGLLGRNDTEAIELLAAYVRLHPHDESETRAFAALKRNGAAARGVVHRLIEHATSTCTMRQALDVLADGDDPGLFDVLTELLPRDTNGLFPINVAWHMARLGDNRAVPHLVRMLDQLLPAPASPGKGGKETEADMLSGGVEGLSLMSTAQPILLALGVLGGEAAERRIQAELERPELALYARGALCLTKLEEQPCKALLSAARSCAGGALAFDGIRLHRGFSASRLPGAEAMGERVEKAMAACSDDGDDERRPRTRKKARRSKK